MANPFRKALAEPLIRSAATSTRALDPAWEERIEQLSGLVQYRVSMTCIAMLGTAILAKALHPDVNLFWFKPTHVPAQDKARSYSARTLCHSVLVPLSAEYGFSLGVSGREPLNNQPYFRMETLDDGTPVNAAAQEAFDYMMLLIREVQTLPDSPAAQIALEAFVGVRRRYAIQYTAGNERSISTPGEIVRAIEEFMRLGSAGGSHAQALAAGVMDAALGADRIDSGRINDPSRHYPGDVCVWADAERAEVAKAIEVRDKPVTVADIHIFARRCQTDSVEGCGILMSSPQQPRLDTGALMEWADKLGVSLRLWFGWNEFVRDALFWGEHGSKGVSQQIVPAARARLSEAEVSAEALASWDALTCMDNAN